MRLKAPSTPAPAELTGEQHGKSFVLEGQTTKQMLQGVLRLLFELGDAQVVRLGKSVYGRSRYLKEMERKEEGRKRKGKPKKG